MRAVTAIAALAALSLLAGCELPGWMGGARPIKRAPGERLNVIVSASQLEVDEATAAVPVEIPPQVGTEQWLTRNEAMQAGHIGLRGIEEHDSATIGDGNAFSGNTAPAPVAAGGRLFAMDAAGVVSAHSLKDIDEVAWVSEAAISEDIDDVLGGGLAYREGVVYATTGYGRLVALDAASGKVLWKVEVGAPVRGAPAVSETMVVVLTADNQALAFDLTSGTPRWSHRGIRESAGYFANTSPVISDGIVIVAYSSGEVFALRAETGNVLWSDNVSSQVKTRASAVFSGIDANPVVQDGVVIVVSAGGVMQANALLNGRPLWQQKLASHQTPWAGGNALFLITDTHEIAALFRRNGKVRWATSMARDDGQRDTTPPLYGPILAGNAVMALDKEGVLHTFKPENGKRLSEYELAGDIIAPPVIVEGALYLVTQDATLHKYYK